MPDYSNSPRDSTRVPVAHRIQLKFDRFSGFINEYVANISPGGIFIRTDSPEPPGQLLEFEFRLGDGFELIRGRGEVVWTRVRPEGPERPSGMGVRFLELSAGSKDLIYKIVDDYVAHGGKPFDLAGLQAAAAPPGAQPSAAPAAQAPQVSQAPEAPEVGAAAAGPQRAQEPSSMPWHVEIPAIQPVPGIPAITPRSPLEALAPADPAVAGLADPAVHPGRPAPDHAAVQAGWAAAGAAPSSWPAENASPAGAWPAGGAAPAAPDGWPSGAATPGQGWPSDAAPPAQEWPAGAAAPAQARPSGAAAPTQDWPAPDAARSTGWPQEPTAPPDPWHPASVAGAATADGDVDPLVHMASTLPALDDLTPPAPAAAGPAAPPPAFAAFDHRAPRRRSRAPLIGLVAALALAGVTVYLLRDSVLEWLDHRGAAAAADTAGGPPADGAPALHTRRNPRQPVLPGSLDAAAGPGAAARRAGRGLPLPASPGAATAPPTSDTAATPEMAAALEASRQRSPAPAGAGQGAQSPPSADSSAAAPPSAAAQLAAATPSPASPASPSGRPAGGTGSGAGAAASVAAGGATAALGSAPAPGARSAARQEASAAVAPPPLVRAKGSSTDSTPASSQQAAASQAGVAAAGRATAIQRITWEAAHGGGTVVTLWGNGEFAAGTWTEARIAGPAAREVIRISGITRPFASARLGVSSAEVQQIRTGYHPPQELHVVLDLARPDAVLTAIEPGPRQLRIHIGTR